MSLNGWEETTNKLCLEPQSPHTPIVPTRCIFVLAGGLQPNGQVHHFVKDRLDKAIEIYRAHPCYIVCMGGGTYHKPPALNSKGYVIHESTACAQYLCQQKIPAQHIYREWASYDTIANGYYAFCNFIKPLQLTSLTVISSEFHLPRVRLIFDFFNRLFDQGAHIDYIDSINQHLASDVLTVRAEREAASCLQFKELTTRISSLEIFVHWFHTEHKAYKSIVDYQLDSSKIANSY